MKPQIVSLFLLSFCINTYTNAQNSANQNQPWNLNTKLNSYRLFDIMPGTKPVFIDLDNDGHPDVMRYTTANGFPVQWIDNNNNMKWTDTCGDIADDCLMVDVNKDGKYGSYGDVIIRWIDTNNDGKADMQIYAEFATEKDKDVSWGPGYFMVNMDLDKDDILNYIDWNTFQVRAWIHDGRCNFFEDYSGKSLILKIHSSPEKINDLRLNWENPFLFYDPDKDGLTEYNIRLLDQPIFGKPGDKYLTNLTGKISYVSLSYDMVNDHTAKNPFSYDMTINFRGEGFSYMDQLHKFKNLRGLPAADQYFMDPRINQLEGFIYPDHNTAPKMTFEKGKWNQVWFIYDEDNDCERWERVELYEPKDPYIIGVRKGGLDNSTQSDPVGDRGEWDLDNSGKGNLYISPLDGKIHLYGAEKGYWRVDQNSFYYQGMGGLYDGYGPLRTPLCEPTTFPLISYKDTDNDGFFDLIEFDLDGDKKVDFSYSLKDLGIKDISKIYDISKMKYTDFTNLQKKVASDTWKSAQEFVTFAEEQGLNTQWYALLKHPKSIRQQYSQGYWLKFYLFMDCLEKAKKENNIKLTNTIVKKYFYKK